MNKWKDGEPCGYPGCLNHVSHPCEGCGRIGGKSLWEMPNNIKQALSESLGFESLAAVLTAVDHETHLPTDFETTSAVKNCTKLIEHLHSKGLLREEKECIWIKRKGIDHLIVTCDNAKSAEVSESVKHHKATHCCFCGSKITVKEEPENETN